MWLASRAHLGLKAILFCKAVRGLNVTSQGGFFFFFFLLPKMVMGLFSIFLLDDAVFPTVHVRRLWTTCRVGSWLHLSPTHWPPIKFLCKILDHFPMTGKGDLLLIRPNGQNSWTRWNLSSTLAGQWNWKRGSFRYELKERSNAWEHELWLLLTVQQFNPSDFNNL